MYATDGNSVATMPIIANTYAAANESAVNWLRTYDHGFIQARVIGEASNLIMKDARPEAITRFILPTDEFATRFLAEWEWLLDAAEIDTPEELLAAPHMIPESWVAQDGDEFVPAHYCLDCNRFTDHDTCDPTI